MNRHVVRYCLLVGLALLIVLFLSLNTLIKIAIEQTLTNSLAVRTTVAEVKFNPLNSYLNISGFVIDNPSGFSNPEFLKVRDFIIQIQPHTLLSDRLEIEKIQFQGISINIEQQLTRNNLQKIFANADRYKRNQIENTSREKKFNLQSATIDNISVNLNLSQLGLGLLSSADYVPKIELKNFNSENYKGLLMSEVLTKLIPATIENIAKQNQSTMFQRILEMLIPRQD